MLKRNNYSGKNPSKRRKADEENRAAIILQDYINKLEAGTYFYQGIVSDTGVSIDLVRKLCYPIACGHHGFTLSDASEREH